MDITRENLEKQLQEIKKISYNKTVWVSGHKHPDVDSYLSMIITSEILQRYGINAKPLLLVNYNEIDQITKDTVESLDYPKLTKEDFNKNKDLFFLVDHNSPYESVGDIPNDKIIGILDHHTDNSINANLKYVGKIGSTTHILYKIYKELDIEIPEYLKRDVLYSLAIDTCCCMSSKTTPQDVELKNELLEYLVISESQLKQTCLFETDLTMGTQRLIGNGLKLYKLNEKSVESSYIEYFSDNMTEPKRNKLNEVKNKLSSLKYGKKNLHVLILRDFSKGTTDVELFGPLSKVLNNLHYDYVASRGSTIMPDIEKEINKL